MTITTTLRTWHALMIHMDPTDDAHIIPDAAIRGTRVTIQQPTREQAKALMLRSREARGTAHHRNDFDTAKRLNKLMITFGNIASQ